MKSHSSKYKGTEEFEHLFGDNQKEFFKELQDLEEKELEKRRLCVINHNKKNYLVDKVFFEKESKKSDISMHNFPHFFKAIPLDMVPNIEEHYEQVLKSKALVKDSKSGIEYKLTDIKREDLKIIRSDMLKLAFYEEMAIVLTKEAYESSKDLSNIIGKHVKKHGYIKEDDQMSVSSGGYEDDEPTASKIEIKPKPETADHNKVKNDRKGTIVYVSANPSRPDKEALKMQTGTKVAPIEINITRTNAETGLVEAVKLVGPEAEKFLAQLKTNGVEPKPNSITNIDYEKFESDINQIPNKAEETLNRTARKHRLEFANNFHPSMEKIEKQDMQNELTNAAKAFNIKYPETMLDVDGMGDIHDGHSISSNFSKQMPASKLITTPTTTTKHHIAPPSFSKEPVIG